MLPTYQGTLQAGRIQWLGEGPRDLAEQEEVPVHVTLLKESRPHGASDGKRMAEVLALIAKSGGVAAAPDPLAWEREVREDRPLPDREQ